MQTVDVDQGVLQEAVEVYLERNGCTLWGRAFDVSTPEGRAEAAAVVSRLVAGALAGADPKADAVHTI